MNPIKTALVTGASGGIGTDFARLLAKQGLNLILVARSEDKLKSLATEFSNQYKVRCDVLAADLSQPQAAQKLYDQVQALGCEVEVLVNNAGFGTFGKFHTLPLEKEIEMIELNVRALTALTRLFLPSMVARKKGRILNVASTAAFQPGPLMAVYYATKAYVLSFSEAISNELEGTGVTVTILCPGPTATGFQSAAKIELSKLVKGRKLPTSMEVAQIGVAGMLRGKTLIVPGILNQLMAQSYRFMPRKWVTRVVRSIQEMVKG